MGKVYKRTTHYKCLDYIYRQGKSFKESGWLLIESGKNELLIPGIINICLSAEIFLKSINAYTECVEDELDVKGTTIYEGREETIKIFPGGRGHALSKLFDNLPCDAKAEIVELAKKEGYVGCVSSGLKEYDDVFVEWRYIYEKNTCKTVGTEPLLKIVEAIYKYCEDNCGQVVKGNAEQIQ